MVELMVERGPRDHHVYLRTTPCIRFELCSPSVQYLAHLVPQTGFHMNNVALFPAVSNLKQKGGVWQRNCENTMLAWKTECLNN